MTFGEVENINEIVKSKLLSKLIEVRNTIRLEK